jgi:CheY-like chemotaxis protein
MRKKSSMAHAFDDHSFGLVLRDAERVLSTLADHEHRLVSLVGLMESRGSARAPAAGTAPTPQLPPPADLLAAVRDLCVAARQQRELAEAIVARMIGDLVRVNAGSPRKDRILLVDDNLDNLATASDTLEASGFDVITTANGLEALIVAHYAGPSVVLMDVSMPILDGLDATRLLKSSDVTPSEGDCLHREARPVRYVLRGALRRRARQAGRSAGDDCGRPPGDLDVDADPRRIGRGLRGLRGFTKNQTRITRIQKDRTRIARITRIPRRAASIGSRSPSTHDDRAAVLGRVQARRSARPCGRLRRPGPGLRAAVLAWSVDGRLSPATREVAVADCR